MSIKINHSDLQLFERLTSKLVKPSELPETVYCVPNSNGLRLSAVCDAAILTLTLPPVGRVTPFTLPWTTIKQLSVVPNKGDDIDVNVDGPSAMLSWHVKGIPQQMSAKSSVPPDDFMPSTPDEFGTFQTALFDALVDAGQCVDKESINYLRGLCLRGETGQVIATDRHQALIQDGFSFPWKGDVLCPVSKIFGAKELRKIDDTVMVGARNTWIFFEIGNVSICLKELNGRYPRLDQFTQNVDNHSWLEINPADASFVAERLASLPGKKDREFPVYIHLNDNILVRGHDQKRHTATELRMTRSRYEGDDAMMAVNRHYLKNALDFGITRLGIDSKDTTPLVGYGDGKTFIMVPLAEEDEPRVLNKNITVLESGPAASGKSRTPLPVLSSVTTAMATTFPGSSEIVDVKGRKPKRTNPVNVLPTVPAKSRVESKSEQIAERENPDRMTKSEYRAAIAELRASLRNALSNLSRLERAFSKSRMREQELLKREREIALGQKQIRQTAAMIGKLQA